MASLPTELEGTWEEVAVHAALLAGRRVRLTVLSTDVEAEPDLSPPVQERDLERVACVKRLRGKFAGTAGTMASELLHRERQADKQKEEPEFQRDEGDLHPGCGPHDRFSG